MFKGEFLCHREEEVQVQEVREAEAVRVVGAVRPTDGAARLTAVLFAGPTEAAGEHRCLPREESGVISRRGFRRICYESLL